MKKLLYGAAALATLLFASCQQENLEPVAEGGVTYTISLPTGVQTKGEAGYDMYDLYYEVYRTVDAAELASATPLFEKKVVMNGNSTTVYLELLNDQDYTVLFWANKKDEAYFNTGDLRNVEMVQAASNNDDRDAFCGMDQIVNINSAYTKTVELKRPFAQINIATLVSTTAGYDVTPVSSLVKVSDIPVAYNVATAQPVGSEGEVTYSVNLIPGGTITYGTESYTNVAMNYVLVPESNVTVYYEINTVNGTVTNEIPNVPVKANYRTNIVGNLLTSDATYTVKVEPIFAGEENVEVLKTVAVNTPVEFAAAIQNPEVGEVILNDSFETEGIVFSAPATRAAATLPGRNFVIDGNGKTLTYKGVAGGRIIDFTAATNGANLTIKNLTIINNVSWIERAVNYNTNGALTLENVTIMNADGCSLNYAINLPSSSDNAKVQIKNCVIWAGAQALNLWGERTVVNVTNSELYVIDDSAAEGRSVVAINNDGTNIADYSVLNFNGGSIKVVYVGEGATAPSSAIRNNTVHSEINISPETVVEGAISNPVAIIYWEGFNQYYSLADLNAALAKAVPTYKATGVRMIHDLTLPLSKTAIYGTPVAVQMMNGGVFDGCNNTLSVENPEYNAYVVETYGGTIKNINITVPAGRGIIISSPKEDIYLDNVLINGPGYAINTTEHNGKNLYVTNSTINGWTSLAGLKSVSFTSCSFGENTYAYWQKFGYDKDYDRLVRPYVQTVFNSCVFENGFYVDLSALAASATITLEDCVCGDVELTEANYSQYITIELPSGRTLADCVVFE